MMLLGPWASPEFYGNSGAEDVVGLERLVDLGEPFGPVGGAAAAALVERQLELTQQAGHLLARGDIAQARAGGPPPPLPNDGRRAGPRGGRGVYHRAGK